jgi:hypothetical protein
MARIERQSGGHVRYCSQPERLENGKIGAA